MRVSNSEDELTKTWMMQKTKQKKNNKYKTSHGRRDTAWPSARWRKGRWCRSREEWRYKWWMDPAWIVSGRHAVNAFHNILDGQQGCGGMIAGCWGALPACGEGCDPGPRGWWQGGPLSSSPPPGPGSAVQTAPPAPWLTPAEPPRSHTAPYTLHGPRGKKVVGGLGVGEGGEVRVLHTHPCRHKNTRCGSAKKTSTLLQNFMSRTFSAPPWWILIMALLWYLAPHYMCQNPDQWLISHLSQAWRGCQSVSCATMMNILLVPNIFSIWILLFDKVFLLSRGNLAPLRWTCLPIGNQSTIKDECTPTLEEFYLVRNHYT